MKYSVLEATLNENRGDILPIWARNLPPIVDGHFSNEDNFEWYYLKNPYGYGKCWLLREEESGQFVGTAGLGPRRIKALNRVISAGLLADFAVDRKHRSFIPAVMLQKKVRGALDTELGVHYSTPLKASASVQLRIGHAKLGEMQRYAKILDAQPYLLGGIRSSVGAKALAPLLNAILRTFSPETWKPVDGEFTINHIEEFDSRFDALWERAAPKFVVTGERTSEFLRWRYTFFPGRRYFTVGLLSRDKERLFGYVVYHNEGDVVSISDLFFEDPHKPLTNLLRGFLRFVRKAQAASVSFSFLGPEEIRRSLRRFGFHPRNDKTDIIVDLGTTSRLPPVILDPSQWYFVSGDREC
jgi:hypothetical protein